VLSENSTTSVANPMDFNVWRTLFAEGFELMLLFPPG
jgi:hypothetical protein